MTQSTRCTARAGSMVRLLLPLLTLLVSAPPLTAQEGEDGRNLYWRELAVQARLDADGRLHVRERHGMVFDGAWNGGEREFDVRVGQELRLNGITRTDPVTGATNAVTRGDLEDVDEFDWADEGDVLRWRSRLPSDPPFRAQEIVYELDYSIAPVLVPAGGDEYVLRHDFAFSDRRGVIEQFSVDLTLDTAWTSQAGREIQESARELPPGRGYTVDLRVQRAAPGEPSAVAFGPPVWVRAATVAGALLIPLLVFFSLRRRDRELDGIAPITPPDEIDEDWLQAHIFAYPAEVVGASWDRAVGEAEVAALLARLVAEGKLSSRIERDDEKPVLHLRRVAPLDQFADHERDLLSGLFFDGGDRTDTAAIRKHYKDKGFDPASKIRAALEVELGRLPGAGKVSRVWMPGAALMIAGAVAALALAGGRGGALVGLVTVVIAAICTSAVLGSAAVLSKRVTHRTAPAVGVLVPLTFAAALLALLASGALEGEGRLLFYRPSPMLLVGLLVLLAGLGMLTAALSAPTQSPERLQFRRRLVSAREFFERELARPEPRLQDAWFPYLLAFGLGSHIDRWFREFGGQEISRTAGSILVATSAHGSAPASSGSGWSGGGPQFGGGSWGGGGAGGSWGVAAAGMAAGVSPPSSSGGGGAASSGGGGGGGW